MRHSRYELQFILDRRRAIVEAPEVTVKSVYKNVWTLFPIETFLFRSLRQRHLVKTC